MLLVMSKIEEKWGGYVAFYLYVMMLIGSLALMGIPFLSGFYSKVVPFLYSRTLAQLIVGKAESDAPRSVLV